MRAIGRACGLLAAAAFFGLSATASAVTAVPATPGDYAIGDAELEPGMTLRLLRSDGAAPVEVGRLRVLAIRGTEVQLELLSGSGQMRSGDVVQVVTPRSSR